ncbi:MAG: ribonuclease P protein component [Nitrospirae bacterium]|nr:ribonuclease P protein component [Nitrospirota bacterium]
MALTIPKNEWIKKTYEYRRVYEKGRRYHGDYIILFALNNSLNYSRMGISVGKKIGGSVKRNRIKRLIREIVRHMWADVVKEKDIVIVAKKEAAGIELKTLWADTERVFKKAGLLRL